MRLRITRLREDVLLPTYATTGSVAFDLAPADDVTVPAQSVASVGTGLVIATPLGHALLLFPRSSLFKKKGLRLMNTVGVIDQDFCGPEDELFLAFWNPTDADVTVMRAERVAQAMIVPIMRAEWDEGEATHPSRGGGGSTGGYQASVHSPTMPP